MDYICKQKPQNEQYVCLNYDYSSCTMPLDRMIMKVRDIVGFFLSLCINPTNRNPPPKLLSKQISYTGTCRSVIASHYFVYRCFDRLFPACGLE